MTAPIDLAPFIKAYDVRGLVESRLRGSQALGAAFVDEIDGAGEDVVVGYDMRDSSPGFAAAFAWLPSRGGNVLSIGLCSTDGTYFASGRFRRPGGNVHRQCNPATWQHQVQSRRRSGASTDAAA
jgi:phosphomannomutase